MSDGSDGSDNLSLLTSASHESWRHLFSIGKMFLRRRTCLSDGSIWTIGKYICPSESDCQYWTYMSICLNFYPPKSALYIIVALVLRIIVNKKKSVTYCQQVLFIQGVSKNRQIWNRSLFREALQCTDIFIKIDCFGTYNVDWTEKFSTREVVSFTTS